MKYFLCIQSTFLFYLFQVANKATIISNISNANDKSLAYNLVSERQEATPSGGAFLDKTVFF